VRARNLLRGPGSFAGVAMIPGVRREQLRANLWLLPALLVLGATVLFGATYALDRAAHSGALSLPGWIDTGDANSARTILTAIAAAVITVAGVVFSVTIVAFTLASTQFGPRILRNFLRDRGTQATLGTFVATFVYSVLALGSVSNRGSHPFVPHLSTAVALLLTLIDVVVLIYFIHHVTTSIQLNEVVFSIAQDLGRAVDALEVDGPSPQSGTSPDLDTLRRSLYRDGVEIPATTSGYLQAIGHRTLVGIATDSDAVIELAFRPGHFVTIGRPLARVWPATAEPAVARLLERTHVTGPHRTLHQDLQLAIDQLVEIAIRALSPAVNDTFTALSCIDWLGDGLTRLSERPLPTGVIRDAAGAVRLLVPPLDYARLVNRSFDQIRQAGRGLPAVGIRQLDTLSKIAEQTRSDTQRQVIARQAAMLLRQGTDPDAVPEPLDRDDLQGRYDKLEAALARARRSGVRPATPGTPSRRRP
jgi:uncharacterized membrane protein